MKGWEIRKMAEFSKENPAAEEAKEPVSRNFIEQMIDKDLEEGVYETVQYQISAGTQRISAYRTCQEHSVELWTCTAVRR